MLNAIILDDNKTHLEKTLNSVSRCLNESDWKIYCFSSVNELLISEETVCPNLAVLDIQLSSGENGIKVAKLINEKYADCQVIFLTSFASYISEVYEVNHSYLVLKDNIEQYLPKAVSKAVNAIAEQQKSFFTANTSKLAVKKILQSDIMYFESKGRYAYIYLKNESVKIKQPLDDIMASLDTVCFFRCHQSFIVNLNYIKEISRTQATLANFQAVPISRRYISALKEKFVEFLSKEL